MDHSYSQSNKKREVTSTLQALCRQEESAYKISGNYLTSTEDAKVSRRRGKCRAAMVTWFITVVDYLEFERETVAIALNFLDRFLETPQGKVCLTTTPRQFKMAGMTCLYTAIKAHEPEAIEPDLVVELSGNLCSVEDIEAMERTILAALDWRVNPPTALAFCRQLLGIVPKGVVSRKDCAALLELAQVQTELAVSDPRLITTPPSLLALASIFNALESSSKHSNTETLDDLSQLFFVALAGRTLDMDDVFDVQDVLDDIIRQHNQPKNSSNSKRASHEEQDKAVTEEVTSEHDDDEDEEEVVTVASPTTPAKEMALAMAAAAAADTAAATKKSNVKTRPLPKVVSPCRPTPCCGRPGTAEAA
ncbi:diatom-specific cyclin [Seminavis robusta]|uniref:Diatom-specific cyclin n=1 Tax=Seminavis robusta TaxID=568900 RepID=A0A9N8H497_9STRA|nr:diatom-specific cyclin [Seminavis robusta]|eukprot:Sro57_g033130.1 diatom-specific cyclin (363) ;mRNA; r:13354-14442